MQPDNYVQLSASEWAFIERFAKGQEASAALAKELQGVSLGYSHDAGDVPEDGWGGYEGRAELAVDRVPLEVRGHWKINADMATTPQARFSPALEALFLPTPVCEAAMTEIGGMRAAAARREDLSPTLAQVQQLSEDAALEAQMNRAWDQAKGKLS